jgi:ergothioneine biosynthesis protein EgtB
MQPTLASTPNQLIADTQNDELPVCRPAANTSERRKNGNNTRVQNASDQKKPLNLTATRADVVVSTSGSQQPIRSNGTTLTREELISRFQAVRSWSETICSPLETEDYVVQSMPDCSPAKWHIAHTSWFFETFILNEHQPDYSSPHPQYNYLFNSYYNSVGKRHARPQRGVVTRPTVRDTYLYRAHVDREIARFIGSASDETLNSLTPLLVLGLHHEQQHQELLVTDLKNLFASNPLQPAYREKQVAGTALDRPPALTCSEVPRSWQNFYEGIYEIGYSPTLDNENGDNFSFDNESPRHRVFLQSFALASHLVTCGEWLEFMEDGGYKRPEFWLSMGWDWIQSSGVDAPYYWEHENDQWTLYTMAGRSLVEPSEPIAHVSYFEADAYARWKSFSESGSRLPTEAEWEIASRGLPLAGQFAEEQSFHPSADVGKGEVEVDVQVLARSSRSPFSQMYGSVWQWTRSQYTAYPGYVADSGALGEYNGKFMCNQWVLRGGSCATPHNHMRRTYRNFFPPDARWQFSGVRLAKDI